jgi:hypothetical protein
VTRFSSRKCQELSRQVGTTVRRLRDLLIDLSHALEISVFDVEFY